MIYIVFFGMLNAALISPRNDSDLSQTHIVFEWEQEADAEVYNLQISSDEGFENMIIDVFDPSLIFILKENLEWNMEYFWRVRAIDINGQSLGWIDTYSFEVGDYLDFISLNTIMFNENSYSDGYNLFGSLLEKKAWIADSNGQFIWYSDALNINPLSNILDNGNLLGIYFTDDELVSYDSKLAVEYSIDREIAWSNPDSLFAHHDMLLLPNGNYLLLIKEIQNGPIPYGSWTPAFQNIGYIADGVTNELPWEGDRIIEINPNSNEIVWSWSVFDHYNMVDYDTLGGYWNSALQYLKYDWTHCNSLFYDDNDGSIYLSSRHLSRITKIDYESGQIIWNLGHQMESNDIDMGDDICFSYQHDVTILDNGNLLFLDNGNLSEYYCNTDGPVTRALELSILENNETYTASIEWEHPLEQMYSGLFMGSCQRLPNGNTLINPGSMGLYGRVFEVDSNGQAIWEMAVSTIINRVYRVTDLYPQQFSVVQPDFVWYLSDPTTYLPLGDNCLSYTIINEGSKGQYYQYEFQDNGIWFNDDSGTIFIEAEESYDLEFTGSVFYEIYPHTITLSVFPINDPPSQKTVSIDAWATNIGVSGCIDPVACNYNNEATTGDCSCLYNCIGDLNLDDSIDIFDIIIIIDIILLNIEPTEFQEFVSDFNLDGSIDINDIIEIVEFVLINVS